MNYQSKEGLFSHLIIFLIGVSSQHGVLVDDCQTL